jgi:Rieske 2Fe-2S family protein
MNDQSLETTYLLPREAYTGAAWFEAEQQFLFGNTWQFAGLGSAVQDTGSYLTAQAGPHPLVVVRDGEGRLTAFHNICRHRGAVMLEGAGVVEREIRCFYHSWSYGLDGTLKRIPQAHQFPDLDRGCHGLHLASLAVWRGMVFVHPDENAPSFESWIEPLDASVGPFRPEELVELLRDSFEVAANWKLFVENHIDGYHLWHLHAQSVRGLDHRRQRWRPAGRHWIFDEPPTRPGTFPDRAITGLPLLPTTPRDGFGSVVMLAFPNLGIAVGATFFATVRAIPTGPTTSTVELRTHIAQVAARDGLRLAVHGAAKAARRLVRTAPLRRIAQRGRLGGSTDGDEVGTEVLIEDLRAAEAVQRGIASPTFRVGPMAREHEQAITVFQRNVLDHLAQPITTARPPSPPLSTQRIDS